MDISASAEMKPFSVGGRYDQPISRRIAEEASLPRGTFASRKQAASALIHSQGEQALAQATVAAVRHFAEQDGRSASFPPRFDARPWQRVLLRVAPRVGAQRLITGLTHRRRRLAHFEPEIGTLLLRWAVDIIRPRYRVLEKSVVTIEPEHRTAAARR